MYHDRRRHTKSGKPTFNQILANLVALADTIGDDPVEIKVRCNVDRENAPMLYGCCSAWITRGCTVRSSSIRRRSTPGAMMPIGGALTRKNARMELSWFVGPLGFSVPLVPKVQHVVCLAVQPQGALVDAHGTLFNSTEVSYVPATTPNRFAIGDVTSGERGTTRDLLGSFNDQVQSGAFGCSRCRMLPVWGAHVRRNGSRTSALPKLQVQYGGTAAFGGGFQSHRFGD